MAGERAYPRARNLLSQSLAIGARLQDPRIIGGTHALDAMCGWLTGRWDLARDRGKEAERILRENCAGAWWELSVARNALLGGLLWGGQWNEYASRLAEFSDDARTRNDLSSLAMYRMNHGAVSLARNDVGQADRDLLEAQRILADAWSTRGFHIPHFSWTVLPGAGGYLLWQPVRCDGPSHSRIACNANIVPPTGGDHSLYLPYFWRGCWRSPAPPDQSRLARTRPDLVRRARRCAEAIRRKPAIWGSGLAMSIEAGADAAQGRFDSACGRWSDAERELSRAGMLDASPQLRAIGGGTSRAIGN